MDKNQDRNESSFLLSFSNEMALAVDKRDLARIIHEKLKECLLIKGFIITQLDGGADIDVPFFYEDGYPQPKERKIWIDFSRNFKLEESFIHQVRNMDETLVLKTEEIVKSETPHDLGVKKTVISPLKLLNKHIGVLWLFCDSNFNLTEENAMLLKNISMQITIAVSCTKSG
jgi:hypothetical protein